MKKWSDEELINALRDRLAADRRAFNDLANLTKKLEDMNARLQESEALKGHFLSNIRNEINNPLTSILGLAGRILDGVKPEQAVEFARLIYLEAHELDFQLQNIFMAAELESGEARPEWASVEVGGVLDHICAAMDHRCRERQITINRSLGENLLFVTDARKLALVIANLLANAIAFSPEGAAVGLMAELSDNRLQVDVADAGPGIPEQELERVFDRFYQVEQGTTKAHRGHGLGLSVARALAELLGGVLTLETTPGQGCLVSLSLPAPLVKAGDIDLATDGNLFLFDEEESF